MKTDDRPVPYDEFLAICHKARDEFAFLHGLGFRLTEEQWPTGDSFKDGFQLMYAGSPVSLLIEYYDAELVIWFQKSGERIPYLFADKQMADNRSGFAGCMFTRNKLANAMHRMAVDIRQNYEQILLGDERAWHKLVALWHAPREKRGLP